MSEKPLAAFTIDASGSDGMDFVAFIGCCGLLSDRARPRSDNSASLM
jgi:hypothetical protein